MNDPVLWVKDRKTKQRRLIRLLRFEKDPSEMGQYFEKIPGEKPFENPSGGTQEPVVIKVSTGDLVADAVMKGKQNALANSKKPEPKTDDLEDEDSEDGDEDNTGDESNSPSTIPTREELEKFSYNDLRSLAKKQGIKIGPKLKVTQDDLVALLCGEKQLEDFEPTT